MSVLTDERRLSRGAKWAHAYLLRSAVNAHSSAVGHKYYAADGPTNPYAKTRLNNTSRGSPDIVIVDDNEADLFFTGMLLKSRGYENVHEFTSGQQIIDVYKNGLPCDVMLMDIRMPDMDGFRTLDELSGLARWRLEQPAVYMMSAAANASDMERVAQSDTIRMLYRKALTADQLTAIVEGR